MATEKAKLKAARQEMTNMVKETEKLTKAMGETSKEMQKMAREFSDGMSQMQQDIRKLREETSKLDKVTAKPKIEFKDMMSKLGEVKKELVGLGGLVTGVALGASMASVTDEAKLVARERALYAASGKSENEIREFEETAKQMTTLNPYMSLSKAMDLISKGELANADNGAQYAKQAALLNVTTKFAPEDTVKMMAAMGASTQTQDATKLANALQHMSNNGGASVNLKFVEAMAELNAQKGNFLKTPEQMATSFEAMGKVLNDTKSFSILREGALKQLTANGALTSQFQSEEVKRLITVLQSGDKDAQNIALAKVLMSTYLMKNDPKNPTKQQDIMTALVGSGGVQLSSSLEEIKKIATGETGSKVNASEAQLAYDAAVNKNEFMKMMQAQNTAKNAAMEAVTQIASDLSGVAVTISDVTAGFFNWFNTWSPEARLAAVYVGGAFAAFSTLGVMLASTITSMKGLLTTTRDFFGRKKEKAASSENSSLAPNKGNLGAGGNKGCCCCDGKTTLRPSFKSKKKGASGSSQGGNKPSSDTGGALREGTKANGKRRNASPTASAAGHTPDTLIGGSQRETAKTEEKGKNSAPATSPAGNQAGPDSGGNHAENGKAANKGAWKSMFKGGFKRIPLLGSLLGVKEIAESENKLDTAAKVGAESLGGWGGAVAGAATGAAIGSILPGVGTAIGGIVGGFIGGMGGSFAGGALYDGVKSWWQDKPSSESATIQPTPQAGPPIPNQSPVSSLQEKPQPVSITIPQISIPLHVQGVLQDIPTMLNMLNDPSVAQRIKDIIERSLLDALETRGGVTT
ncbi:MULTISPECIES: hypothetical protein [Brevibacillus]|uniref:hypothetical protein n=1 Tax=Brevibacillus TaxID=55080 RepID=UPI000D0F6739|nr:MULTISPECIES: hypothetical protein [Brevibacillus]MED1945851.1 hypothetical protein [Brevibacillus formosus]MED2001195.1 hypothetical protein [Brevibacillus formosus]MED2085248.1 hypothetical protein [Brevibacillus formosus]PSK11858.1 hypothetical protein C7R94_25340 [Brevibacillus sp. NRRL NRS-603]